MKLQWTDLIELTQTGVARIREIAGIYRLSYFDPARNGYHVYYTGQAGNLNERLGQHLPVTETNASCQEYLSNYKCYFRAAVVSLQADRDAAEAALYNYFKPACVDRVPAVNPVQINIS